MIGRRPSLARRRERARAQAAPGPLRDHLATPVPDPSTPLADLPLLAVDLETTGLDPVHDRVLSLGWVPVDGGRVHLAGARRFVVRDAGEVGQSATVHGLTDDVVATGVPLEEAAAALLGDLSGRVLLAHYARIETTFLGAACQRLWGAGLPCAVVDTIELERRAVRRRGVAPRGTGGLRLWTARARRALPVYQAHEALTDALACAELYLAQRAEMQARRPGAVLTLRDVLA